jgi:Ca2+-binding RTX toxin-like protein
MAVVQIDPTSNTTYVITGDDDTYVLHPARFIYTTASPTIHVTAAATGNGLVIHGSLGTPGDDAAILIEGQDTSLTIAKRGFISAKYGIEVDGVSSDIVNRGLVSVDDLAFFLSDSTGRFRNYGEITTGSLGYAVNQSASSGSFLVENYGLIAGYAAFVLEAPELVVNLGKTSELRGSIGLLVNSDAGDTAKITNDGLIATSAGYSYNNTGDGRDVFVNRGTVHGQIFLGAGDDRLIDKGVILSFVTGGSGDDTFILRRHVSIIEGASGGTDSVRIGVTFGLTAEVENLRLTGKKNADATGNGEANIINGNSGNNVIAGGTAADTLSGGGGRDTFLYAKFDGGDTITDFRQGQDRIRIEGFTQFDSFGDLDFVKSGEDVRISFADENGADFILVENQKIGDFDKGDFLFG